MATGCFVGGTGCACCAAFGGGLSTSLATGRTATEGVAAAFGAWCGVEVLLLPVDGLVPDFVIGIPSGVVSRPLNAGRGGDWNIALRRLIFYRRMREQFFVSYMCTAVLEQ